MEIGRAIKVVYVDEGETKVLKGTLIDEDMHTLSIQIENIRTKTVMVGKRALVKVTYTDERHSE